MSKAISRRQFVSTSAAGIGVMASARFLPVWGEGGNSGWVKNTQINPMIDNLRVVNCYDPLMVTDDPKTWDIAAQNTPVAAERVKANINTMACALAQKPTPAEAWATIFRKPESKQWSEVKVALKPNGSPSNTTRVAVIDAVCSALIGLGVMEKNIMMYGYGTSKNDQSVTYAPYLGKGLPAGIILSNENDTLWQRVNTAIPEPCEGEFQCVSLLVNGSIDILVNMATNKGHMFDCVGGVSLTMKNHAGTFEMPLGKHFKGGLNYIIAFNKSNAIIGGTPPRQQLCIVDSLWGNKGGPSGIPNTRPCSLSMGTFGPAVDWVVIKKIREPIMGCKHPKAISRILTEFGYEPTAFSNLDFIKVEPV